MDTAERDLIKRVGDVAVARPHGRDALHRPLLLLWALGQVVQGKPRLQRWSVIHQEIGDLLRRFAEVANPRDGAVYPFAALRNDGLWDVPGWDELTITSKRRPTLESLDRVDPVAGLPAADYDLLAANHWLAAKAAALLIVRYINPNEPRLLKAVGLDDLLRDNDRITTSMRPAIGERFINRTAIHAVYGGPRVAGIGNLDDGFLCLFSDDNKGPYADSRIRAPIGSRTSAKGSSETSASSKGTRSWRSIRKTSAPCASGTSPPAASSSSRPGPSSCSVGSAGASAPTVSHVVSTCGFSRPSPPRFATPGPRTSKMLSPKTAVKRTTTRTT